jgi:hypothetical protein
MKPMLLYLLGAIIGSHRSFTGRLQGLVPPAWPDAEWISVDVTRITVGAAAVLLQHAAELEASHSQLRASVDAEQQRLLGLVSTQATALADKERQLEVRTSPGC